MRMIAPLLFCAGICIGCHNTSPETLNAFRVINESLETSNEFIKGKTIGVLHSLEQKIADPMTAYKAQIWKPKADSAAGYADSMLSYIENLKELVTKEAGQNSVEGQFDEGDSRVSNKIFIREQKGNELFIKLNQFRNYLLNIDPEIKSVFENILPIDTFSFNSKALQDPIAEQFDGIPAIGTLALLNKFENDVNNSEAYVVDFCNKKIPIGDHHYDDFYAIAGSNSQYFKPGMEMTITAGLGAFSRAANPTITIDGKTFDTNVEGYVEYKVKVGSPGKYSKNVKISFTKPDGVIASIVKKIEYEVGECGGSLK